MTRSQWVRQWRETRIQKRLLSNDIPSTGLLSSLLKELYNYIYLPKQDVFIYLTNKYKDKLSPAFILKSEKLIESWKPEAKKRSSELMRKLVYSENPFLKMIPKTDEFSGNYIPSPIEYKE